MYNITFYGLNCWFENLFKKLGWMVLAYAQGNHDITDAYIINIKNLQKAVSDKLAVTKDEDKINDLKVMQSNIDILLEHCHKDFKQNLSNNNNNKFVRKVSSKSKKTKSITKTKKNNNIPQQPAHIIIGQPPVIIGQNSIIGHPSISISKKSTKNIQKNNQQNNFQ